MKQRATICLLCGESKAVSHFMKHRNDNLADRLGFCKVCVNGTDINNRDAVTDLFRMMNIPFVEEVWESQFDGEEEGLLGRYLRVVATKKEFKIYDDSIRGNEKETVKEEPKISVVVTPEMIERWGVENTKEEYYALEKAYQSLVKIKTPSTHQDEKRYVINVKLQRALDLALDQGEIKQVKGLREAYTKDLKELGLDLNSDDEELSVGQRIREWERVAPTPELDKEFIDVDNIEHYFNKYFTIPMKRVFGQATGKEISELYDMEVDSDSEE